MPSFGRHSTERLETCHPHLIGICREIIKHRDCSVFCGHRNETAQTAVFENGQSKTPWPRSKHNTSPSRAIDIGPYPVDWDDRRGFDHFAGYVLGIADIMGIPLRWGGDWDGDNDLHDQSFNDLVHFELKG